MRTPNDSRIQASPLGKSAAGLDRCVHCGFCLQACPTYLVLEDENDSPRGRLLLMRGVLEGELPIEDPSVRTHLDRCLGCRGCESACPSGVPYGQLLEAVRETMVQHKPLPVVARAMLAVFARPRVLAFVLAGARMLRLTGLATALSKIPGRLGFASAMLASTSTTVNRDYVASGDGSRGVTGVLEGCVMKGLFAETNRATSRVLTVNGYDVRPVPGQLCCGALHAHAGDADTARKLARANIAAFERAGVEFVAVNASGCGAAMKEYGHLLHDDPAWKERARDFAARVRDVSELLAAAGPVTGGPIDVGVVTYDPPCHLLHAQRVVAAPVAVLRAIPNLTIVPLVEEETCCGSAGIYNLVQPDVSNAVLERKLANIQATGAHVVATGNPGCLMQIGAGLQRQERSAVARHPVDLLDASYAARRGARTDRREA
ncbi:MAG: heterodisulfide reductase-related iron-sulfur binding cluster [Gemmatimonadaceae bacterium]